MNNFILELDDSIFDIKYKTYPNAQIRQLNPTTIKVIYNTAMSKLSDELFYAILEHEFAHFELGHLTQLNLTDNDILAKDIQADAYAVRRIGLNIMNKLLDILLKQSIKIDPKLYAMLSTRKDRLNKIKVT